MTDTERNIIALIEEKIRGCESYANARPDQRAAEELCKRRLMTLADDIRAGLHMPDKSLAA